MNCNQAMLERGDRKSSGKFRKVFGHHVWCRRDRAAVFFLK